MATVTLQETGVCGGSNHITINSQIVGGPSKSLIYMLDDFKEPITADDIKNFVIVLMRLHAIGKTNAQVRTNLQNGISVVI